MEAQRRLDQAAELMGTAAAKELPAGALEPETLLSIARHLLDTNRHVDYLRSAELAQVVIDYYGSALSLRPSIPRSAALSAGLRRPLLAGARARIAALRRLAVSLRKRAERRVKRIWLRGPLLVLLLSWLALGLAGAIGLQVLGLYSPGVSGSILIDTGFDVWAIGFLALVGFGFYVRVRTVRF